MLEQLLEVVVPNAADLAAHDKEAFTKIRKQGLGASDSSVVLGVNQWKTVEELIEEKKFDGITEAEREVGEKENVRKGADLEPIILQKFIEWSGLEVAKPEPMFRLIKYPWLTINFDGLAEIPEGGLAPVECKWISPFAKKYWNLDRAIENWYDGKPYLYGSATSVADHVAKESELYGIPPYYYTQVQQQLLGTDENYAFLAALFDKGWDFKVFKIYQDPVLQEALVSKSKEIWDLIKGE